MYRAFRYRIKMEKSRAVRISSGQDLREVWQESKTCRQQEITCAVESF